MSSGLANDAKERIRQAVDLVELIGSHMDLRRQGSNFVGHCPWHDDHRPSLLVNPERQSWKCWVCNIGGDLFNFTMQREGVNFREALQLLADRAGIPLTTYRSPADRQFDNQKRDLYQTLSWAEEQYHRCLLEDDLAKAARGYLAERGLSEASVARYRMGFAPDSWQWLLDRAGRTEYSAPMLEAAGLAVPRSSGGGHYDRFRGRLMFAIRDTQDRPIAFGGRVLPELADREPAKYINTPETRLFSKSEQLYGLDVARHAVAKSRRVLVMEGYTDVVMANQCGVDNVVAVLGTALGRGHLKLLKRFAETVILVLDGDQAGRKRANQILELFVAARQDLRILTLPEGLDPCDFLRREGGPAFNALIEGAVDALEHRIRTATEGIDLGSDTHRAHEALEEILGTLALAPVSRSERAETDNLREQQILARLAREFRVEATDLRPRLADLRRDARRRGLRKGQLATPAGQPASNPLERLTSREIELFETLALHETLVPRALESIDPRQLSAGPSRDLFEAYEQLETAGRPLDSLNVRTELEDPTLKFLLVELESRAQQKADQALLTADERLEGLIQSFRRDLETVDSRAKIAALESKRLDEKEAVAVVQELIQRERDRHGISEPTDG